MPAERFAPEIADHGHDPNLAGDRNAKTVAAMRALGDPSTVREGSNGDYCVAGAIMRACGLGTSASFPGVEEISQFFVRLGVPEEVAYEAAKAIPLSNDDGFFEEAWDWLAWALSHAERSVTGLDMTHIVPDGPWFEPPVDPGINVPLPSDLWSGILAATAARQENRQCVAGLLAPPVEAPAPTASPAIVRENPASALPRHTTG